MIVVKVGGAAGIDLAAFARAVAALTANGQRMVVVHGGSAETNRVAESLGSPPRFVTSPSGMTSRYTDRETLDGRTIVLHGDHTGTVDAGITALLETLLQAVYLPVVSPPALSHDGVAINVDGDRAAAAIATSLGADTLLLLSNVPGLLRDLADESSVVEGFAGDELDEYARYASGRMRMKLLGAAEAVLGGVQRVILGDARTADCVTSALAGAGTVITGPVA